LPEQHLNMKSVFHYSVQVLLEHVSYRQTYMELTQKDCSNLSTVALTVVRFCPKLDYAENVY